ncbi:MAG: tRNA (guanosine(46)-N7)-methyltransferase TrmB [Acholeplasmatales bacterium]|nr:tRNA (guanosine(46)-N7)-methyltransferase TrmB [Acholeplasmatales bacterium]
MRLRKIKGAREALEENKYYFISHPEENKGKWSEVFKNNNPIHLEVGCGKGNFIIGMAKAFPEINFVAIEKFESVLIRALEKIENEEIPNLKIMNGDALTLCDIFEAGEVFNIYLNFSDPWPKSRHAKRRLTYKTFLDIYRNILNDDGAIMQKTDNKSLFEFSIESFSEDNWVLSNISVDLHSEDVFNIMTEYEVKKSKLGPIYRLEARKRR